MDQVRLAIFSLFLGAASVQATATAEKPTFMDFEQVRLYLQATFPELKIMDTKKCELENQYNILKKVYIQLNSTIALAQRTISFASEDAKKRFCYAVDTLFSLRDQVIVLRELDETLIKEISAYIEKHNINEKIKSYQLSSAHNAFNIDCFYEDSYDWGYFFQDPIQHIKLN